MAKSSENWAYRGGIAIAVLTSFPTVWTTIVRDDGQGMMFFEMIMAAVVGAFATWFRPEGMARTMVGVAVMQVLLGIGIATAPITAQMRGAPTTPLIFSAVFAGLWLASAAFFRVAARMREKPTPA